MKNNELVGKKIELIEMPGDHDPVTPGSRGRVISVVEFSNSLHLNVDWDPEVKRSLNLVVPPDSFKIIE